MDSLYFIYYNGKPLKSVGDVNELIEVKTSANPKFYTNRFLAFKIQDLLNGMKIKGVTLDKDNFIVKVELEAEPIVKKYRIDILPATNLDFFHSQRAALKVVLKGKELELDNTMSFSLVGEENDIASPSDLNVTYSGDPKYVITRLVMSKSSITLHTASTELPITLTAVAPVINNKSKEDKVEHNDSVGTAQQDAPDLNVNQKHGICPISDVMALKLDFSKCKAIENSETINVAVKGEREDRKFKLVQSVNVPEDKLCKLSIPESWAGLTANIIIEDETGKNVFKAISTFPNTASTTTIAIDGSGFRKKTLLEKTRRLLPLVAAVLLSAVLFGGIGYGIQKPPLINDTVYVNTYTDAEREKDLQQMISDAQNFLAQVDSCLKVKDLKFGDVEYLYTKYNDNSGLYSNIDKNGVFSKLKAYNTVVEWIREGGPTGWKHLQTCFGAYIHDDSEYRSIRPLLSNIHVNRLNECLRNAKGGYRGIKDDEGDSNSPLSPFEKFLRNHSSYDSFDDMIEDLEIVDRSPDRMRRRN